MLPLYHCLQAQMLFKMLVAMIEKRRKKIDINSRFIVQKYNRHMGGVDLLDSLMGRYKIKLKRRKWYM